MNVESDASPLLQHFLIGLGVGLGLVLAIVVYIWFKRARDKAGKVGRQEDAEGLKSKSPNCSATTAGSDSRTPFSLV